MGKDYTKWHQLKSSIERKDFIPQFQEREIWWCSIGMNIGSEEDGKNHLFERPVIILQKFSHTVFLAIPMTSRNKPDKYHFQLEVQGVIRSVILSQIRVLSGKRLLRYMGKLSVTKHGLIIEEVARLIKRTPIKGSSGA